MKIKDLQIGDYIECALNTLGKREILKVKGMHYPFFDCTHDNQTYTVHMDLITNYVRPRISYDYEPIER